ncbi:CopY family transcriptional regulator [Nesterenkonia sp. AN1]|uniref:DNA-binding FrmR family transcriptional regulator n=2 Tax=Micrococcaceae TaxID=1268 RepID=A0A4R7G7W1_9MICC|nr:CopY family transcriptional regulator [Nesterenkonia sp. AN1]TDS87515.1 DNA-binding FrmR family transcriptional regulator [Nesterenkonia aurantiaca]
MDSSALENPADTSGDASTETPAQEHHHGYMTQKDRYLGRLRRIEGQSRGIHRMVEEDAYCIDILTQISATTAALENVAMALLEDHLRHCVADAVAAGGDQAEEKLQEATAAIRRLVKS